VTKAEPWPLRVFLVGFMGSGKTTVGRLLADAMNFSFVDLDRSVEVRSGSSIAEIFADSGETEFRRLERRALIEAAALERVVVATGGGAFASEENRDLIAGSGVSVWLNPDFATVLRRISAQGDVERPLFADPEQAAQLFASRRDAYRRSDRRVDVAPGEGAGEIVERILAALPEGSCAT